MTTILKGFVFAAALLALPLAGEAQGRDFSGGITDINTIPVATDGSNNADWLAKQKATEAAASAALAAPVKKTSLGPGQLGPGDKIRMTVFGEEDLSGEFEIDSTGSLAMPLVGDVPVRGLTPRELEKKIAAVLGDGYLKNARVNVEVMNFRPFFILGEVNKPGSYPFANDMNVINAVALGGGYTTRAKTNSIKVRRANNPEKEEWISPDSPVYPGDVLTIDERFF